MSKGTSYPAESRHFHDEHTGAAIRRITSHPSIHHHPFFMIGAYDDAMERLFFTSERTGKPQLFAELRATGRATRTVPGTRTPRYATAPTMC